MDESICGYCHDPLPVNAVSSYFCSQGHQEMWGRNRSEPVDEVALYHRWRDRGGHIMTTMNDIRAAFTGFGSAVQQCGEALQGLNSVARPADHLSTDDTSATVK